MLRSILLGVVALLVVTLVGARLYLESFAKPRLEAAVSAALGTETTVDRMSLGLLAGAAGFRGLAVRNPEGYRGDYLLQVGAVDLGVALPTLLEPEIVLTRIVLEDVRLELERAGRKSNYREILDNLGSGDGDKKGGGADEGGGRRVLVNEIRLSDVRARVQLLPMLGGIGGKGLEALETIELEIPEIRLENVGAEGSRGQVTEEVTRLVLAALLRAVGDQTADLTGGLSRDLLSASRAAGSTGLDVVGEVTRSGGETLQRLPGVGEAGKKLGEGVADFFDAVGRRVRDEKQ